jgi:SH3-like domain-containing protein
MLHGSTPARMRGAAGMMLASATLLTLSPSVLAAPQSGTTTTATPAEASYWAVVTGNAVNVRSGPSAQSAYAFGKLKQGDVVRVLKEEYGWARVSTEGSAFGDVTAFVTADRRVALSPDGKTATVSARTELRAPNMDAGGSPDKSWKQVGHAEGGTTLSVLGTATGEKESVYKVRIPGTAEAWVNMQFIRRANASESAAAVAAVSTPVPAAAATTVATAAPTTPAANVVTPVNAPDAGTPAPTPITPDIGVNPGNSSPITAASPAIPALQGAQPVNASTMSTDRSTDRSTDPATGVTTTTTTVTTRSVTSGSGKKAAPSKWVAHRATLDDLEHQFKGVREQADVGAEFEALRNKYEELASTGDASGSVKGVAGARAKQLSLLIETQTQMQQLERKKTETDSNRKGIADLVLNIQRRSDYTAIGILNASAVYDGERLPELYRICDPTTSATIAYVEPNADIPMATMIGTLVGVKGGQKVDPALRLTVISPLSMDLLTQRSEPQVTKTDATRPIEDAGKFVPASTVPAAAPTSSPVPTVAPAPTTVPTTVPAGFEPAKTGTP